MYVEDIELCWRLKDGGWTVRLEADVTVPHVGNAAGEIAWGAGRARVYMRETYDFYRMVKGSSRTRSLGLANAVGSAWRIATSGGASLVSRPASRRAQHRSFARGLINVLPVHVRAAVGRDR
jgi:GT2 family glycosyltransferase